MKARFPAIRLTMLPRDTNALGSIFGGVILSYVDLAGAIENFEYFTRAGSLTFPGGISSAMSVAAICWQNNRLEDYSSQGPTPDGRLKPDIAGQSVVTTSFQTFTACPSTSSGTGGFNGTSAAAPHVSGAAALVKGANPGFTPAQVQAFLEGRGIDLGAGGVLG